MTRTADISEAEARDLTERLRAACARTNELVAQLPQRARRDHPEFVYFIRAGYDGPIKIGSAKDVEARVRLLQTGSAEELHILGTLIGGTAMERRLHKQFAHLRIRGEWFRAERDLLVFIEVLPR